MNLAAKKNAKKKAAKARKNAEAKKAENEVVEDIAGLFLSGFCVELWQWYASFGLQLFELCKYGVIRSLLSKCVSEDETGKIFSALAIMAAVIPMAGNATLRTLYKITLETFPAAEILLCASILMLASALNFVLYTQKWRIALFSSQQRDTEPKSSPVVIENTTYM